MYRTISRYHDMKHYDILISLLGYDMIATILQHEIRAYKRTVQKKAAQAFWRELRPPSDEILLFSRTGEFVT